MCFGCSKDLSHSAGSFEYSKFMRILSLNMYFGCSKEPSHSDGSFEYPKFMRVLV